MPTITPPEKRKLAFRKRIRLNKLEAQALEDFLILVEAKALAGTLVHQKFRESPEVVAMGIRFLGAGVYKAAFALPTKRYVVKIPTDTDAIRGGCKRARAAITTEPQVYTSAPEDVRVYLARSRMARPWASLQEYIGKTEAAAMKEPYSETWSPTTRLEAVGNAREARSMGQSIGLADLHAWNIAIRPNGTAAIIDYAELGALRTLRSRSPKR